ncbi:SDR family oxidoreductase [Craterilacuibacter sinensis]|uniref:NAD(P)H-binding protein n=1 Tax=Craterilacuibacter sinensis TaxID=2686017 RepID=A0A845BQW9_9NEIS|nr:SDR family oxidoreductase [Craterilacuibacter sinensis]MXR37558.1 NAD(P)H-binding protein [Craterilacuibacter sinensis]
MQTLLIIGFGDIARRASLTLPKHWRILAMVRSQEGVDAAHNLGITPVMADLDDRDSLTRLAALADKVLYCAPPASEGHTDQRMRRFLSVLNQTKSITQHLVYISTSGVYGDAGGDWLDETRPPAPGSDRSRRRLDAEQQLRCFATSQGASLTILRAPGIYAAERLPLARIINATPAITREQDSWSNHIHADDLAMLCVAALKRPHGIRVYNACDKQPTRMGDWFDLVADAHGLARVPRLPRTEVRQHVSPVMWSFLAESRRLHNQRILRELGVTLQWPDVQHWIAHYRVAQDQASNRQAGLAIPGRFR